MWVACFLLAADCQDECRVELWNVSIQRDIASRASTDDELSEIRSHGAAYEGTAFQYVDCTDDVFDASVRVRCLMLGQMSEYAIEVVPDLRSELDPRHD